MSCPYNHRYTVVSKLLRVFISVDSSVSSAESIYRRSFKGGYEVETDFSLISAGQKKIIVFRSITERHLKEIRSVGLYHHDNKATLIQKSLQTKCLLSLDFKSVLFQT